MPPFQIFLPRDSRYLLAIPDFLPRDSRYLPSIPAKAGIQSVADAVSVPQAGRARMSTRARSVSQNPDAQAIAESVSAFDGIPNLANLTVISEERDGREVEWDVPALVSVGLQRIGHAS